MASAKVAKAKKQGGPTTKKVESSEEGKKLEDYEILSTIGESHSLCVLFIPSYSSIGAGSATLVLPCHQSVSYMDSSTLVVKHVCISTCKL